MKNNKYYILHLLFICLSATFFSCEKKKTNLRAELTKVEVTNATKSIPKKEITPEFKEYWYSGTAEISSYQLKQARYGEIREGKSVLIYVTEPLLANKQVKADNHNPNNIPVLKLNATKKYLTGIYPYSLMTSSFYSVHDNQHATKVSFSGQEWCGHVYAQINNKENYKVTSHSYFEKEADQNFSLPKEILENEIWNKIRINPINLPIGKLNIIPSLEYIRLSHKEFKSYQANASIEDKGDFTYYSIWYPELDRTIKIQFQTAFPHKIEGWEEFFHSGFGKNKKKIKTIAKRIHTISSAYWNKNKNKDIHLRDSLSL